MDFFLKVKDVQVIFPYMFYISKGFKVHQREDECLCVCVFWYIINFHIENGSWDSEKTNLWILQSITIIIYRHIAHLKCKNTECYVDKN